VIKKAKMKQKEKIKIIVCLALILVICLLQSGGLFKGFEDRLEDGLFQQGSKLNDKIFVIGIDEETLSRYGAFDTWSRDKIADVINVLMSGENRPKVIAVDIGFYGEKDAAKDAKLAKAAKDAGNVVLTTSVVGSNTVDGYKIILMEEPYDSLRKAALSCGFSNLIFDDDGVVRHSANEIIYEDKLYYSFDNKIAEAYLGKRPDNVSENFYITYSGKSHSYSGSTGAGCSFYKVLEGEYPLDDFKDAIVIIGAYASGTQDNYYTSIDKNNQMYGAEIHANIVNQILSDDFKSELSSLNSALITFGLGLVALAVIYFANEQRAIFINIALCVAYIFFCRFAYLKLDVLLPIFYGCLTVVLITITHIVLSFVYAKIERKKIVENYSRYMAPELAVSIADKGEASLKLGGSKKDIAVLFVDIRGFTSLSEVISPEEIVSILNQYFEITTKSIMDNNGIIDKFIGDATMGLFNALTDLDDYVYCAVCAGLDMIKLSEGLDDKLPPEYRGRVHFGVGVHTGPAVVGNIGTHFRMDYTAIGDTVNTASRIEGQAKASQLLISEEVYQKVKDRFVIENADLIQLKGKKEKVQVYSVIAKK